MRDTRFALRSQPVVTTHAQYLSDGNTKTLPRTVYLRRLEAAIVETRVRKRISIAFRDNENPIKRFFS